MKKNNKQWYYGGRKRMYVSRLQMFYFLSFAMEAWVFIVIDDNNLKYFYILIHNMMLKGYLTSRHKELPSRLWSTYRKTCYYLEKLPKVLKTTATNYQVNR